MNAMQRAVGAVPVALAVFAGTYLLETAYIADQDLQYPVVLLTKVLGTIIVLILVMRVVLLFIRERVRAVVPHAEEGLRALGKVALVAAFSIIGCVFGVTLMINKPGAIQFWPLGIVLVFAGLCAYCTSYIWRVWKMSRRSSGKR